MKQSNLLMLSWLMSFVLLSCFGSNAETKVTCLIFSGNAEKEHNIDLAKLNRITFSDNSMVISSTKDDIEEPVELLYSLYHHLEIGEAEPTAVQAESITLSQETAILKVGEQVALTATVMPEKTKDKTVTWISSDESIATVDAEGKVTAKALGETVITATCGSVSATCAITVVPTPAENITINRETATLKVGETIKLAATVLPEDATYKTITWTSSNESVAMVNAEGKVTAKALGETVITATCGSVSATCTITVVPTPAETITISQMTATLNVGEIVKLTATVLPEDATYKTITWTSSNESVAMVNAEGKVTAKALGETVITATCGSVSATCAITVVPTPAETITINQVAATLKVGETVKLTATVLPEDATYKTATWTSTDESVATVDAEGKVTAKALGETVITATCGSVSATCAITVVPTPAETITINQVTATMNVGETVKLTATVLPEDATYKTITWTSSNESVATVDTDGKVTANGVGEAVITASCGSVSVTCTVTIVDSVGVDIVNADSNTCIYIDTLTKLLYMQSASDSEFSVGVFNINGQLLLTAKLHNGDSVSLETLSPGVYITVATDRKIQLNQKFILK